MQRSFFERIKSSFIFNNDLQTELQRQFSRQWSNGGLIVALLIDLDTK
jgi:hypothetical protein